MIEEKNNDVLLPNPLPQAVYSFGCTVTAVGMLLGYYDEYGYEKDGIVYDMSSLIDGDIELNSRNGYSQNHVYAENILLNCIASEGYVSRFWGTQVADELSETYIIRNGVITALNTASWDCLADYMGTGEFYRANSDTATSYYQNMTLKEIKEAEFDVRLGIYHLKAKYVDYLYGLSLYTEKNGYLLDVDLSRHVTVDALEGSFTFEDYVSLIDSGHPVILNMTNHSVVGYGYNRETNEIIFDDTFQAGRMAWNGSYYYAGEKRYLESATIIAFDFPAKKASFYAVNYDDDSCDDLLICIESTEKLIISSGEPIVFSDLNTDSQKEICISKKQTVISIFSDGLITQSPLQTPENAVVINKLASGWKIAGIGDFNGNGTDDVLIFNPTAASSFVGLIGYWEDGKVWNLIDGFSPEWDVISVGDFNGDGKCDMLWKNTFLGTDNKSYDAYCTWIMNASDNWRMVSVVISDDWDFLCSGDFDGDGTSDIAMINQDGVVGIWGISDGYLSSWSILSAMDVNVWNFACTGDFNGDGTDDFALYNTESQQIGYWLISGKTMAAWKTADIPT